MAQSTGTRHDGEHAGERSVEQVEAELAAARARLAGTVDDLAEAVSPQELAKRQGEKVKEFFVGPEGVRVDRVAKVAGTLFGLATLRAFVRRRS
jgi:hypothetical protein